MQFWFGNRRRSSCATRPVRRPSCRLMLERLEDRTVPSTGFVETPLVSNIPGLAPNTDRELINPWGFFETPAGQFRVAANGSGQGILFNAQGHKSGADINIPPPTGSPPGTTSTPNGLISNPTSDFVITVNGKSAPATLLFSTEDGTIAGWNPSLSQTRAVIAADQSGNGAVYKLLTMGSADGANYLYATNFHNGTVDVFDSHFTLHTFFAGQFTDPNAPAGFAPFGVKNVNGILFVTYAKQDAAKHDDVAGPGNGFIDEFTTDGHFIKRFASGTAVGGTLTQLNSPIGATFAPAGFGNFGGDLLIGNFGDSHVSAFDPNTGQFLGQLQDTSGHPLVLTAGITGAGGNTKGLWGIGFGNGQGGAGTQTLFFADGPDDESDGVFGMVNVDPAGLGVASSPQIDGQLLATAAIADNDIWAVGFSDQVTAPPVVDSTLAEHWDGKSWSIVPTPPTPSGGVNPPNAQFMGVAAAASNDVWAVGFKTGPDNPDFGEQLIEHWNGTSWSIDTTGPENEGGLLRGVTVVSSNNVWAVGGTLVEHWNGTSWSAVSSPAFAGVDLVAVSADASNDIWAVGSASSAGGAPFSGPAVLHFDGTNWSLINPNTRLDFTAVTALSPTNVWAVGTVSVFFNHKTHHQAAIEHWDGTSWSIVSSPAPTKSPGLDSSLDGIAAVSASDIWAAGSVITSKGQMATLTEHWDGTSWKIIGSPNPGNFSDGLSGATALSDGTVAAVGFQQDQGFDKMPLILQNTWAEPKAAATTTMMSATTDPAPADSLSRHDPLHVIASPTIPNSTSDDMGEALIDEFFQMLDARLISLESAIIAQQPQLDGMIQSFNAELTLAESVIASHPVNDLSGKL